MTTFYQSLLNDVSLNYYSILASTEIASEKQEVFKGFYESEYANGSYFKKYLENENALEEIQDIIDNSNDVPDVVKDLLKVAAKILKENLKNEES